MNTIPTPRRTSNLRGPAISFRQEGAGREAQHLGAQAAPDPTYLAALLPAPAPDPEVRGLTWKLTQGADTLAGAVFLAGIVLSAMLAGMCLIFAFVLGAFGIYP
jgi:hypothetical protein